MPSVALSRTATGSIAIEKRTRDCSVYLHQSLLATNNHLSPEISILRWKGPGARDHFGPSTHQQLLMLKGGENWGAVRGEMQRSFRNCILQSADCSGFRWSRKVGQYMLPSIVDSGTLISMGSGGKRSVFRCMNRFYYCLSRLLSPVDYSLGYRICEARVLRPNVSKMTPGPFSISHQIHMHNLDFPS